MGWAKISGAVRNRYVATNLSPREHEVAKLTVFGFSIRDISMLLHLSESTVKQTVARIISKTGVQDRTEFAYII